MSRKVKGCLWALVLLLVLWGAGFAYFNHEVFKYIDQEPTRVKDTQAVGIAVLTGGRYRISKGVELLNEGYGARLIISGVTEGVTLHDIALKDDVVIYDDMPVDLGYKARTTVGNAKEIKDWAEKYQMNTIYAVTSFYHIPRSRLELHHFIPNVDFKFVAVSSGYVRQHWWKHWGSFKFLMAEYCKYLAVMVQYFGGKR